MFLDRNVLYPLEIEAYTYFIYMIVLQPFQQTVVETLSPSQPVSVGIKCHTGDDGQVDSGIVGEQFTTGFLYAEGTFFQLVVGGVAVQFNVVPFHGR